MQQLLRWLRASCQLAALAAVAQHQVQSPCQPLQQPAPDLETMKGCRPLIVWNNRMTQAITSSKKGMQLHKIGPLQACTTAKSKHLTTQLPALHDSRAGRTSLSVHACRLTSLAGAGGVSFDLQESLQGDSEAQQLTVCDICRGKARSAMNPTWGIPQEELCGEREDTKHLPFQPPTPGWLQEAGIGTGTGTFVGPFCACTQALTPWLCCWRPAWVTKMYQACSMTAAAHDAQVAIGRKCPSKQAMKMDSAASSPAAPAPF